MESKGGAFGLVVHIPLHPGKGKEKTSLSLSFSLFLSVFLFLFFFRKKEKKKNVVQIPLPLLPLGPFCLSFYSSSRQQNFLCISVFSFLLLMTSLFCLPYFPRCFFLCLPPFVFSASFFFTTVFDVSPFCVQCFVILLKNTNRRT